MSTHDKAPRPGRAEGPKDAHVVAGAAASIARAPVTVIDCACGRCHHIAPTELAELGAGCKPELVGVPR